MDSPWLWAHGWLTGLVELLKADLQTGRGEQHWHLITGQVEYSKVFLNNELRVRHLPAQVALKIFKSLVCKIAISPLIVPLSTKFTSNKTIFSI